MIEPILLSAARVCTFSRQDGLTNASGFFFERGSRLFLITSRHVLCDETIRHAPDRIEIELHVNPDNMVESRGFSIPLYRAGRGVWRQAADSTGTVDVAAVELDRAALPPDMVYRAFTPDHLPARSAPVEVGDAVLVVGFPLGFHDALHHMPVVRQAVIASSFGLRFQGMGYFLTDARTHRGTSGAPVVMRLPHPNPRQAALPWTLLGVHSARLDMGTRDRGMDEALGLNCVWYSDILMTMTEA
jgi:hypothetical protein